MTSTELSRRRAAIRKELRACAQVALKWAENYPEDVFPNTGTSTDCISARMARHTSKMIAAQILDARLAAHTSKRKKK